MWGCGRANLFSVFLNRNVPSFQRGHPRLLPLLKLWKDLLLRFSRNDRTVEVIKLFIIWLTVWSKEKENYSSGSHQFTSGDSRVNRFIHRLKPRAKLSTLSSVKFTTGKHIIIVTAAKRYFSRLVPQLDGGLFPTFVAKLQGEKVVQNNPSS